MVVFKTSFLLTCAFLVFSQGQDEGNVFKPNPLRPGPWVDMSHGAIWPRPAQQNSLPNFFVLDPKSFKFELLGKAKECNVLERSLDRFYERTFPGQLSSRRSKSVCNDQSCSPYFEGILHRVIIKLDPNGKDCEHFAHPDMLEKYELRVMKDEAGNSQAEIVGLDTWGALRGLESFSQLVYSTKENGFVYQINFTTIRDEPRYSFRGVMLDSSRHFLSMKVLMDQLDLMEMNKINVFHWHLTDDPSFPFVSQTFPNLTQYGAFDSETHVYNPDDVRKIIDEARIRGIRVIPEFDTPGHTKSWELGQPGLLTPCEDENGIQTGIFGPMDPTLRSTFSFLADFFEEIVRTFPDKYLHIGGDEVDLTSCWRSNRKLNEILRSWGMAFDYKGLEAFYIQQLQILLSEKTIKKQSIVWQEIFDNDGILHPETIIEVWKGWGRGWQQELNLVTAAGHQAILSAPWYLNYIKYGSDWVKFYKVDPSSFGGNSTQQEFLLGGEVCLWGEFVNSINAIPRLWPRASAAAEVLWSPEADTLSAAGSRLQEHECRMMARGYPVQPVVGAGFCPVHWNF
eukprot:11332.XXX_523152_525192_1 [CDS] Oithona nana genome sequencing.